MAGIASARFVLMICHRNVQDQGQSDVDTRVRSRNIRWAAAAMAAMLLISGVLPCDSAHKRSDCVCHLCYGAHMVSATCNIVALSHAVGPLQHLLMYAAQVWQQQ